MIKIVECSCEHDFQDKKYGKKQRVHNYAEKKEGWRCTVCSSFKPGKIERKTNQD